MKFGTKLPYDEHLLCIDRFDLNKSEDFEVPFWHVLQAALEAPTTSLNALLELLEVIAITLRGTAGTDYELLRQSFVKCWPVEGRFFEHVWPILTRLALELPTLFPQSLLVLSTRDNEIELSRRQVACLFVHQFLCTLTAPAWMTDGSPDFHIWYSSNTPHSKAVEAYLFALFHYFDLLASPSNSPLMHESAAWPITFTLRTVDDDYLTDHEISLKLSEVRVTFISDGDTSIDEQALFGLPGGAAVISANKDVGFGRTASQEEMVVGCSPELCVVVLLTPTLRDNEVLVVRGAQPMISMAGYGRNAHFVRHQKPDNPDFNAVSWRNRTVLFMDALELDSFDTTAMMPDFISGNIDRELRKAYTAFSWQGNNDAKLEVTCTGLWGCGSFGGNREAKTVTQWLAASLAGTQLHFFCAGKDQAAFASALKAFVELGLRQDWKLRHILDILYRLEPKDPAAISVFRTIEECMKNKASE